MNVICGRGIGSNKSKVYRVLEFDSLDEFLQQSKQRADRADGASNRSGSGSSFYNSNTFDEAWSEAWDGWSTVRPKVDAHLEAMREQLRDLVSPVDARTHDMVGFEPDIDKYLAGELECMWENTQIEQPHSGKVFTLLLDVSLSSSQDKDEILKRGATVIALVEAFQMFGFELEIWTEHTVGLSYGALQLRYDDPTMLSILTRVCRAGDRPDINAIMYPLANSDWLRRLVFGVQEGEPTRIRNLFGIKAGRGYGTARQGAHHGERLGASVELSLEEANGRMSLDPVGFIMDQLRAQGVVAE